MTAKTTTSMDSVLRYQVVALPLQQFLVGDDCQPWRDWFPAVGPFQLLAREPAAFC